MSTAADWKLVGPPTGMNGEELGEECRDWAVESVMQQILATVRPMEMEFFELSRWYADEIIAGGGYVGDLKLEI
jgi:hypothetical protein